MFVQYDDDCPAPPPRTHPWTVLVDDPEARYWNFRDHPEQIPNALEDFRPWAHYPAIPKFYELLTWLNGPESIWESNDCGMVPPKVDVACPDVIRPVFQSDPLCLHGRLTVIFRDLDWNASRTHVNWLKRYIHDHLRDGVSNFPSVIYVGEWSHLFTEIEKEGHAVTLQFWAWGEDEVHAMTNLHDTFDLLLQLFKHIAIAAKTPATPSDTA